MQVEISVQSLVVLVLSTLAVTAGLLTMRAYRRARARVEETSAQADQPKVSGTHSGNGNGNGHAPHAVQVRTVARSGMGRAKRIVVTGTSGAASGALSTIDASLALREKRFIQNFEKETLRDMMRKAMTDPDGLIRHIQDFGEYSQLGAGAVAHAMQGHEFVWREGPDGKYQTFVLAMYTGEEWRKHESAAAGADAAGEVEASR